MSASVTPPPPPVAGMAPDLELGTAAKDRYALADESDFDAYQSAIQKGYGYSKVDKNNFEQGELVVAAPETIYSAISLIPTLAAPPAIKNPCMLFFVFFPLFAGAVLSAVAQAGAAWYVFELNANVAADSARQGDDLCSPAGTSYFLRLICMVVFIATCSSDLKETYHYFQYMWNVPSRVGTEEDRKALNEVDICAPAKLTDQVGEFSGKKQGYRFETFAFGGFLPLERAWAYFWGVVKLAMEVLLLVCGVGYVLYASSNEDLLMNSVALTFVSQIDDTAYSFCATRSFKGYMKGLPQMGFIMNDDKVDEEYQTGFSTELAQLAPFATIEGPTSPLRRLTPLIFANAGAGLLSPPLAPTLALSAILARLMHGSISSLFARKYSRLKSPPSGVSGVNSEVTRVAGLGGNADHVYWTFCYDASERDVGVVGVLEATVGEGEEAFRYVNLQCYRWDSIPIPSFLDSDSLTPVQGDGDCAGGEGVAVVKRFRAVLTCRPTYEAGRNEIDVGCQPCGSATFRLLLPANERVVEVCEPKVSAI